MATRRISKSSTAAQGIAPGNVALIGVDTEDGNLYVNADGTRRRVNHDHTRTLAAATTLTAADSGTTVFLADVDGFTVTLPAPEAGLKFKFVVALAPTEADYLIVTADEDTIIQGAVASVPADDAGVLAANEHTITFVVDVALVGDYVELVSDGTNWYASGIVNVLEAITFTAA